MKTIVDDAGNRLDYKLNLSEKPEGKPLLVVLHGHGGKPTNMSHAEWNVLAPFDNNGFDGKGCWWLGKNRDFFIQNLLQKLIKNVSEKYRCQNDIFFYGSSMGGYGAILHGILANARAVYANVPQIRFSGTEYFKENYRIYDYIFGKGQSDNLPKQDDLVNYINSKEKLPTFFVCESSVDLESAMFSKYLEQHALYFMQCCYKNNLGMHFELVPQKGHDKIYGLNEVIGKFNRFVIVDELISSFHRDVYVENGKIVLETESSKEFENGFDLYHPSGIEKSPVNSSLKKVFDLAVNDGKYRAVFLYKSRQNVKKHVILKFSIVRGEIMDFR